MSRDWTIEAMIIGKLEIENWKIEANESFIV